MNMQPPSCTWVMVLIATVFGPAVLWAAEPRGIGVQASDHVLISGISEGSVTAQSTSGPRTLHFGDAVNVGEPIETGERTVVDVLIGQRAVVTLGRDTTAQLIAVSPEQTTIQVTHGMVRVAASTSALGAPSTMIIQTPTNQVKTQGGIVRVLVKARERSLAQASTGEAKPYLASYSPPPMVAAFNTGGDIIQVEEGTAEISGAGPGGETLKVKSGQSVIVQAGQAGSIADLDPQETMRAGVLADAEHSNTPEEGVEHLVALQVAQATQLGHALTGAAKTGQDEDVEKDANENTINGATGGVQLTSLVNTLFGNGSASNPSILNPTNSTGGGFSLQDNDGTAAFLSPNTTKSVNGGENALLVFTKKEPVEPIVIKEMTLTDPNGGFFMEGDVFLDGAVLMDLDLAGTLEEIIDFRPIMEMGAPLTITSEFTVERELVLVGGAPNDFHGGIAPTERLLVQGALPGSNVGIPPTITSNVFNLFERSPPDQILAGNSTFLFKNDKDDLGNSTLGIQVAPVNGTPLRGGILGQFSNDSRGPATTRLVVVDIKDAMGNVIDQMLNEDVTIAADSTNRTTGAITATSSNLVPVVNLLGGVTLDRGTQATIGITEATDNYFQGIVSSDAKFKGSLLSVINGPTGPTSLTVQDRLLGVYDGSTIQTNGGNKALLSVLDAQLKGPSSGVPLIDIGAGFLDADINNGEGSGSQPEVTVTSAVVTRSTIPLPTIPLDGALLEASAPLLALTQAMMITTSHFADLAGNLSPSIKLNDALVALNASQLLIQNGHLLNLNDATATVNGYLFSLNNGSTLTMSNGTLFSLNNGSALNLNANALGVFGSGANTLSITNNLCAATCGSLVNSANTPFLLPNGSPLKVAGVTQDVVLPNNFNVFAGNPASTVNISTDAALFHVDNTSTLTINGTAVVKP